MEKEGGQMMSGVTKEKLLEVKNLGVHIPTIQGKIKVVDDISFSIDKGEVVALVGESGCGKSMTALSLLKLLPKNSVLEGSILFNGKDIVKAPTTEMHKIRGGEISMIFQEPMTSLNPVHRIGRQIVENIRSHTNLTKKAAFELAVEMLTRVGIPDAATKAKSYPHQLSGGQRQRVMIAMALSCRPALLIADEPTTALDVTIQAQILDLMRELKADFGTSMLFISHDLGVISEVADRIVVMYAGKIVEESTSKKLFKQPEHPYTKGLLRSLPDGKLRGEKLETITGFVPSVENFPEGCRFHNRCPAALPACQTLSPSTQQIDEVSKVACWLHTESKQLVEVKG
jgi:oligopeptide/dipeptide ABC transporter ATP-binding protein